MGLRRRHSPSEPTGNVRQRVAGVGSAARTFVVVSGIVFGVTACGSTSTNGQGQPVAQGTSTSTVPSTWLFKSASAADYLQWTDTNGQLSGVLYITDSSTAATGRSENFTGTLSAGSVILDFGGTSITGMATETTLTLNFQQSDGSLQQQEFQPGTFGEYGTAARQIENSPCLLGAREAQTAVDAYQAANGSFPPSLASLVPSFLKSDPSVGLGLGQSINYDPATGKVTSQC